MESKQTPKKHKPVNFVALIFLLTIIGSAVSGNPLFILCGFAFCFLARKRRERATFGGAVVRHAEGI